MSPVDEAAAAHLTALRNTGRLAPKHPASSARVAVSSRQAENMLNSCQRQALTRKAGSRAEAACARQAGRAPRGWWAAAACGVGPACHGPPGHAPGHACRRRYTEGPCVWAARSTGRHGRSNRCACPAPWLPACCPEQWPLPSAWSQGCIALRLAPSSILPSCHPCRGTCRGC